MQAANLVEVFSSVQGEGPYVGQSTLFVRFGECDLRCRWCDSPQTWRPAPVCRIETERGSGRFRERPNPTPLEELCKAAEALELAEHRFVSLTGGEPLLQPAAVRELAEAWRSPRTRILLETHGLAVEALDEVLGAIDVVSMDWKLASEVRRAGQPLRAAPEPFHEQHERFLRAAHTRAEVVVKVVVTRATEEAELDELAARMAAVDPSLVLVVQPVTPFGPVREAPEAERLLAWVRRLSRRLGDVRLIPQTHKQIGAL